MFIASVFWKFYYIQCFLKKAERLKKNLYSQYYCRGFCAFRMCVDSFKSICEEVVSNRIKCSYVISLK